MSDLPIVSPAAARLAAWLLTYALHSTLLLSLAWLASRRLARRSLRLEEAAWRFALLGAMLTASLQLAAGWTPAAGRWALLSVPGVSRAATLPAAS
nr:hypothetical protein [Acidobacteriota bacterium]